MRSTDGQALFTDKASILNCWAEHFQTLFGNDRTVDNSVILQIPQQHIKEEMDLAPTLEEVIKSLDQEWQCCRHRWHTARNLEAWRHNTTFQTSQTLCVLLGITARPHHHPVQEQRRKVRLFKIQGNNSLHCRQKSCCTSCCRTPSSPESQCGFRANRGTADRIRLLHEKCCEQNK